MLINDENLKLIGETDAGSTLRKSEPRMTVLRMTILRKPKLRNGPYFESDRTSKASTLKVCTSNQTVLRIGLYFESFYFESLYFECETHANVKLAKIFM